LSILSGIVYLSELSITRFIAPSIWTLPRVLTFDKTTRKLDITCECCERIEKFAVVTSSLKHAVGPNLEPHSRTTLSVISWFRVAVGRRKELAYRPASITSSSRS